MNRLKWSKISHKIDKHEQKMHAKTAKKDQKRNITLLKSKHAPKIDKIVTKNFQKCNKKQNWF